MNRVSGGIGYQAAGQFICNFMNGNETRNIMATLGQVVRQMNLERPGTRAAVKYPSRRSERELKRNLKRCLDGILKCKDLEYVERTLNRFNRGPIQVNLASSTADLDHYRIVDLTKKLTLGKNSLVLAVGTPLKLTLSEVMYDALLKCLLSGEIERIGFCAHCESLSVYRTKRKKFCSDQCRWDHHNTKPERKQNRVKGVWKPSGPS
jgi:hypothetical protein